jgi:hypothetical protein
MAKFEKASKKKAKLRAAIFGPSGAGKTFTALRMAKGMGGKIALIDTEHRTASKYADRFEFDTCDLQKSDIVDYVEAISSASEYDVLIIDSMSHGWRSLLEEVDRLAMTKYRGNTWSAWSEGTPKQAAMVEALLSFPGHIIATMRSKTEWTTEQTGNGKSKPVRIGLSPDQGKGIEYEFDLLMEMNTEHFATIIKDRSGKFQDQIIEKPSEQFGADLAAWLSDGVTVPELVAPAPAPAPKPEPLYVEEGVAEIKAKAIASGLFSNEAMMAAAKYVSPETGKVTTMAQALKWEAELAKGLDG